MLLCRLKMYQTTRWRALVFPVKTQHAGEFHGGSVEVGLGLYWILWYSVYRGKLVQAYAGVLECLHTRDTLRAQLCERGNIRRRVVQW